MEHIIIQLYVPAIGENFDLKIPLSMMILDLVKLLGQAVETLSNGRYCASGKEILCLKIRSRYWITTRPLRIMGCKMEICS